VEDGGKLHIGMFEKDRKHGFEQITAQLVFIQIAQQVCHPISAKRQLFCSLQGFEVMGKEHGQLPGLIRVLFEESYQIISEDICIGIRRDLPLA